MNQSKNIVTVYACGGTGINIGALLEQGIDYSDGATARARVCYLDTSKSNLTAKTAGAKDVYVFDNVDGSLKDGSGKIRRAHSPDIVKKIPSVLQQFKPTALNVVIHSASGGSGAVIGASIASELLSRGENVIAIMVGTDDTLIELENTVKAFETYENIATSRGAPMVVHYLENGPAAPRSAVNKNALATVDMLCGLFSGEHEEMDSSDLKNWLNFLPFIPGAKPKFTMLTISVGNEHLGLAGHVDSAATIGLPDMNTRLPVEPAYQTVGMAPSVWLKETSSRGPLMVDKPIHYLLSTDAVVPVVTRLNKKLREMQERLGAHVERASFASKGRDAEDNGLVL